MRRIGIMDTTLRDAQQCLWATRMTTPMMLPVAKQLDEAGYEAIDLMGSVEVDVCVNYLKENPWERIRLMREQVRNTPLKAGIRSKSLATFRPLPDDLVYLWVQRLVVNGIKKISVYDALFDHSNIIETIKVARQAGASVGWAPVFSESPIHTDELYVQKTKELLGEVDLDHIMIKDSGGLLTPDRVRTLVPVLKKVIGSRPLELHSHCMTGLAPLVYLEGVKVGADILQTATAPLANGPSQPATQTIVRNLRQLGYTVDLDDKIVDQVGEHFREVAKEEGLPLGAPREYDAYHYKHQIPGGMLTNLEFQLKQAGLLHRFDDLLVECIRIREELGWPIMVTPFSQIVATQAVYNITSGERYKIVPDDVKKYCLGYFGKLLAPIDPDVLDRVIENGSKGIPLEPKPLEPVMDELRKKYPNATDEERMMRYMFVGSQVDEVLAAGPIKTTYIFKHDSISRLLREIMKLPRVRTVKIESGPLRLKLSR